MRQHNKKLINKITPPIAVVGCELLRRKGRRGLGEQVLDWEDGEIWQIGSANKGWIGPPTNNGNGNRGEGGKPGTARP